MGGLKKYRRSMKGFFIEITNNLLEPKHRKKMGTAVWEFMWCLDKITKIDENQIGWVFGGKPINLKDIKNEIGITESKISKNLSKLESEGYLEITHAPYGLVIKVMKAQKRFAQKGKVGLPKRANLHVLKGKPNIRQDNKDKTIGQAATPSVAGLNDLIELFKPINPSYERLFANTTQRSALERLVKKHGQEKILWTLNILPKTNSMKFAPTITTPIQLEEKLGMLISFINREKLKAEDNKNSIVKI